jgi:alkylhydroperoxidase/carboxymuconolactone decarboxylase family protein YurZ
VYAGIPAANTAFAALKRIAAEDGQTGDTGEEPS